MIRDRREPGPRVGPRLAAAALAAVLAAGTRFVALRELPLGADELAALPAATWYAERMVPGRWHELPGGPDAAEHEAAGKLLSAWQLRRAGLPGPDLAGAAAGQPVPESARPAVRQARTMAAALGVLQVGALALASPLGGLWLALDTSHVTSTSQAGLEPLPGLLALLAIFLFERALRRREPVGLIPERPAPRLLPLLGAALFLGLTAAARYPHGLVAALAMAPFLALRTRGRPGLAGAFAAVAILAFLAADPSLWHDPLDRLWNAGAAHLGAAASGTAPGAGLPWWQPLAWLSSPSPASWQPGAILVPWLDYPLLAVAALSAPVAWRARPVWVVWAAAGLLLLLAWPIKLPHHTLLVRAPLCGCAGLGVAALWAALTGGRRSARHPTTL